MVSEFLTSCSKNFTTQVQVTVRVYLLKLGTVRKGLKIDETRESLNWAALVHWEVKEKRLGNRFRELPGSK